jgi:hypothetical protein
VAHSGLIHLQVDVIAARQLNLFTNLFKLPNFVLEGIDLFDSKTSLGQFIGEVGERPNESGDVLIQRLALRLVFLELVGVAGVLGAQKYRGCAAESFDGSTGSHSAPERSPAPLPISPEPSPVGFPVVPRHLPSHTQRAFR